MQTGLSDQGPLQADSIQCSFIGQFIGPIFIGFIVDLTDQWSSSLYVTIFAGGISLGVCTYYLITTKNI